MGMFGEYLDDYACPDCRVIGSLRRDTVFINDDQGYPVYYCATCSIKTEPRTLFHLDQSSFKMVRYSGDKSMDRFLTPAEAGKMTAEEDRNFQHLRDQINKEYLTRYVPNDNSIIKVGLPTNTTSRVRQKLKDGLVAAGWFATVQEDGLSGDVTINISVKASSGPVIVDKRSKS